MSTLDFPNIQRVKLPVVEATSIVVEKTTPTDDTDVATKKYVDDEIAAVPTGGGAVGSFDSLQPYTPLLTNTVSFEPYEAINLGGATLVNSGWKMTSTRTSSANGGLVLINKHTSTGYEYAAHLCFHSTGGIWLDALQTIGNAVKPSLYYAAYSGAMPPLNALTPPNSPYNYSPYNYNFGNKLHYVRGHGITFYAGVNTSPAFTVYGLIADPAHSGYYTHAGAGTFSVGLCNPSVCATLNFTNCNNIVRTTLEGASYRYFEQALEGGYSVSQTLLCTSSGSSLLRFNGVNGGNAGSLTQGAAIEVALAGDATDVTQYTMMFKMNAGAGTTLMSMHPTNGICAPGMVAAAGGTAVVYWNTGSGATAGQLTRDSSSARYKSEIEPIVPLKVGAMRDAIDALQLRSFKWKDIPTLAEGTRNKQDYGLIAEEVAQCWPEFATLNSDGVPEAINHYKVMIGLVAKVQYQTKQLEAAEARAVAAETRLAALEARLAAVEAKMGSIV